MCLGVFVDWDSLHHNLWQNQSKKAVFGGAPEVGLSHRIHLFFEGIYNPAVGEHHLPEWLKFATKQR